MTLAVLSPARFIIGRAGSGKSKAIIDEIAALLADDPLGEPILLIVPDQATLLYEQLVAAASPTGGYTRVNVIAFRQLIERLLEEAGGAAIPEVTPLGRRILIGRQLRRLQPELSFYKSTARQPGLANRLDEAFAELEHSGRSSEDLLYLAADIEAQSPQSALPAKLRDLRIIYTEYEKVLGNDRLDQHRRLRHALEAAQRSRSLPQTRIYVDGFYDLTRSERLLLLAVIRAGAAATISFTMDPADATPAAAATPLRDHHPFRASTNALRRLRAALQDERLPFTVDARKKNPRFGSDELLHLERQFLSPRPLPLDTSADVRLIETSSRRAEVDAAARQILDWLIAGRRLRDILVLARDTEPYLRHIEASFREHNIPSFIDRQRQAMHEPLVRTFRAMTQIALSDFHPDAVTELMKCGLAGMTNDECDAMENYLLAHRIRGLAAWREIWSFRIGPRDDDDERAAEAREELDAINTMRARLVVGLQPLLDCDDSNTCTARQWCQRMCESLERLEVHDALARRITDAEAANQLETAARQREVWTALCELLDQLTTVLGDEPLSLREFSEVIDVAIERFVLTIAPPTIDQVLGGIERTRSGPVKACIVLGLSDGIFPARHEESTALTDDDRRLLDARQIELKAGARLAQLDEQFLAYLALTRASHSLTVTRPMIEDDGRSLTPSMIWTQIRAAIREVSVETVRCAPSPECVATPRQLVEATIDWAALPADALSPAAIELAQWTNGATTPLIVNARAAVARAEAYDNKAALSASVAARLYPSPLRASATRLETFAACPFKHFAQHALRLMPREENDITHMDLGIVYHRVLDRLVRRAIRERHDFAEPLPDLTTQIEAFGHDAAMQLRNELLLTPGRNAYLLADVRRTLVDVVETQRRALALGRFRPAQTELAFGFDDATSAPPLAIDTPQGRRIELRGKIDRVDLIDMADHVAATVIDYKLGAQRPDFDRIYFGLSLQLVTYLLVLAALGEEITDGDKRIDPAAALYVKLMRRIESVDHPDDAAEAGSDAFFLTGSNKARGLIDERFAGSLDVAVSPGKVSPAYGIRGSDKPIELQRMDVLDHQAFGSLVRWAQWKIGMLADQIIDGVIKVHPYRLRTMTPCPTCDYRAVCRLDLSLNTYRGIRPLGGVRLAQIVEAGK